MEWGEDDPYTGDASLVGPVSSSRNAKEAAILADSDPGLHRIQHPLYALRKVDLQGIGLRFIDKRRTYQLGGMDLSSNNA